jgi:Ca2+-binding RTX toxin-like protein
MMKALTSIRSLAGVALVAALTAIVAAPSGNAARGQQQECFGKAAEFVLNGNEGVFRGTNGPDVILGSNDDDRIRSKGGNDRVCARDGDDRVDAGRARDRLHGGFGYDVLRGRTQEDLLVGQLAKGPSQDFCLGGKPFPDTPAAHDTARDCSEQTSVLDEEKPVR